MPAERADQRVQIMEEMEIFAIHWEHLTGN